MQVIAFLLALGKRNWILIKGLEKKKTEQTNRKYHELWDPHKAVWGLTGSPPRVLLRVLLPRLLLLPAHGCFRHSVEEWAGEDVK